MKSYQQKADHLCGAACVRDVLDHFGRRVSSERTLGKRLLATFEKGVEPLRIELLLQDYRLDAQYLEERNVPALLRRLASGWVPIVCGNWWDGHYMVLTAFYDADPVWALGKGRLTFADPAASYDGRPNGFTDMSVERFKAEWRTPHTKKRREVIYTRDRE